MRWVAVPSRLELDVRDQKSIERMAAAAEEAFGHLDILVNNAGCNVRKPALDITWDDWNLILDTNLRGSFFVAQAVARRMISRQYGRIINIGSVTSVAGYAGLAPYGASRGGIRQLTMSLADDWGHHGITVNCLAPGWFRTDQNKVLYEDKEWVEYLADRIPVSDRELSPISTQRWYFSPLNRAATSLGRLCWWMAESLREPSRALPEGSLGSANLLMDSRGPSASARQWKLHLGCSVHLHDVTFCSRWRCGRHSLHPGRHPS